MASRGGPYRTRTDPKSDAARVLRWRRFLSGRCPECMERGCKDPTHRYKNDGRSEKSQRPFPKVQGETDENPSDIIDAKTMTLLPGYVFGDALAVRIASDFGLSGDGASEFTQEGQTANREPLRRYTEPMPRMPGDVVAKVADMIRAGALDDRASSEARGRHKTITAAEPKRPRGRPKKESPVGHATEVALKLSHWNDGFTIDDLCEAANSRRGPMGTVLASLMRKRKIYDTGERRNGYPVFRNASLRGQQSEEIKAPKPRPKPKAPEHIEVFTSKGVDAFGDPKPDVDTADEADDPELAEDLEILGEIARNTSENQEPEGDVDEAVEEAETDTDLEGNGGEIVGTEQSMTSTVTPNRWTKPKNAKITVHDLALNGAHPTPVKTDNREWVSLAFKLQSLQIDLLSKRPVEEVIAELRTLSNRCANNGNLSI